jgi:hypothetical protein
MLVISLLLKTSNALLDGLLALISGHIASVPTSNMSSSFVDTYCGIIILFGVAGAAAPLPVKPGRAYCINRAIDSELVSW